MVFKGTLNKISLALAFLMLASLPYPWIAAMEPAVRQVRAEGAPVGQATYAPAVQLAPVEDTYVQGGAQAANNFGASTTLAVKTSSAGLTRQALMKFDLSSFAGPLGSAKLKVYGAVTDGEGSEVDVQVYGLEQDGWSEGTLTWNTRPQPQHYLASAHMNKTMKWHEYDVTSFVKRQQELDQTASFLFLEEANPGLLVQLNSKENAANKPYLELSAARVQEASPVWPSSSGLRALRASANSAQLSWTAATDAAGVSGYRVYRNGTVIGSVYGQQQTFTVNGLAPGTRHTFKVEAGNAAGHWSTDGPYVTYEANQYGLEGEGESYVSANFTPSIQTGAAYSGGKFLSLFSDVPSPNDGYWVQYAVYAPVAGAYRLDVASSPINAAWASPYDLKINDGPFAPVSHAVEYGKITDTVRQFHLQNVVLEAGLNTLSFRVKERRTQPDTRYAFFLDSFQLTFAHHTEYEGETAFSTNFAPGVQSGAEYSGGRQLALFTDAAPPAGGYVAEYRIEVSQKGLYQLDVAATPHQAAWSSPYEISVNGGSFKRVTEAVQYATVNSMVYKYHLEPLTLQAGSNSIVFRVTEPRQQPDAKYAFFLDWFRVAPIGASVRSLTASAPMNVFQYGQPASFQVRLSNQTGLPAKLAYSIRDYWDQEVSAQTLTLPGEQDTADISLSELPKGHYRIKVQLAGAEESLTELFSIVTSLADRPQVDDSPFGLDAAMAWIVPKSKLAEVATVLKLTGATWIRDRFRWNDAVNPEPGTFNFAADVAKDAISALSDADLHISDVYHSAPSWTRNAANAKLPDDLIAAYQMAKQSADYYGDQVKTWEVWNEPDITYFANPDETADKYAAFLKAASIGYRDAASDPHVAISGFALLPGVFEQVAMENELLPYFDIYNFHRHQRYKAGASSMPYPSGVELHQQFLDQYGGGAKPMWVTEAGISFAAAAPVELTHRQQVVQARYMVTSTVTSIAQGTDKHFGFLALPLQEGAYYWGMLSRTYTPYAAYAAEAVMTEALGRGDYIGPLKGLPSIVTGHAFRDGSDTVAVLWSSSPEQVTLQLNVPQVTSTDIMGKKTTMTAAAGGTYTVAASLDPVYIRLQGELPQALVQPTDRPIIQPAPRQPLTTAERVVLAQLYPAETRADSKENGYSLKYDQPNKVRLEVNNLNALPMRGTIVGSAEGGWLIEEPVRSITVQPYSKTIVEFDVVAGSAVVANIASPVSFHGEFGGERTTKSVAYVRTVADDQIGQLLPGSGTPAQWRLDLPNAIAAIGAGTVTAGQEPGSVQFKYQFGQGDKWAYPFLLLPEATDYSEFPGFAFHLYADQKISGTTLRLFVKERSGARFITSAGFTIEQGWNQIKVPFGLFSHFDGVDANGKLDTNEIVSVQIGINTTLSDVPPFTIKNFGVYGHFPLDRTPPVTTATVSPEEPDGENGWYLQPVTVSLHAVDNKPGLISTTYSLDQGATWTVYTDPIVLDQSGTHELRFRSSDAAGNVEPVQTLIFKIV
ncbi:DNRLRE domain-containing protein [Paenibacillus hodogayensis]|uniref:DNRLRE domain-containing protein n=1 Tax=Paenibacillus hodogayensis TaxID=279208 RepID=A0ABV5VP90_9BACL